MAGTRGASGSPPRAPQGCPDAGVPAPGTFGGTAGGGGTTGPGTLSAPVPRTPRAPSSSMNHCPLDLPVRPLPRSI
ncbi:hypothetical protein GCM10010498_49380 [Streptomyces cavourensis]|nr:hypothetical protein GCM10010498_49380 [Streptomyces cavourensis]